MSVGYLTGEPPTLSPRVKGRAKTRTGALRGGKTQAETRGYLLNDEGAVVGNQTIERLEALADLIETTPLKLPRVSIYFR